MADIKNEYPDWLKPFAEGDHDDAENIETVYVLFVDHVLRNGDAYLASNNTVKPEYGYNQGYGAKLRKSEKNFLQLLAQKNIQLWKPLPVYVTIFGETVQKKEVLVEFKNLLEKVWPLKTKNGKQVKQLNALSKKGDKIVFTQPTFEDGSPVPAGLLPILKAIESHNLYQTGEFYSSVSKVVPDEYIDYDVAGKVENKVYKDYVKSYPVGSHRWLKRKFTIAYPVGLTAIASSPFSLALIPVLPAEGVAAVVGYSTLMMLAGLGTMFGSMFTDKLTYYELTPKGKKLLEELEPWVYFQKNVGPKSAYVK